MATHDIFNITQRFDAPREQVWRAWTEQDRLKHWWGPAGCTIDIPRFEFRPGGFFHYAMNFEDTPAMWGRFLYREIVPGDRIVWLNSFANDACGIARAPFSDRCPLEIQNVVTFADADGATLIRLEAQPFGAAPDEQAFFDEIRPSMGQGNQGMFDRLTAHLAA
jgi:uncharacterized protein YndB with AHSA1/START domain